MRGPSFDESPPNISEELKEKFKLALKGKLHTRTCRECPQAQGFVQAMEFVIDMMIDATERMDVASQRMEDFIELFKEIEIAEMKARMGGADGL